MVDGLLNLVFPRRCPFCRGLLFRDEDCLCDRCRSSIPYTGRDGLSSGRYFSCCISPLRYEGTVREAMLRFKFGGTRSYAEPFGRLLSAAVAKEYSGRFELVTWVPVSRRRLRQRGYDQAELLARSLCRELGVPCRKTLKKVRHTSAQSLTRSRAERQSNISGAYAAVHPECFSGKKLLLVDDIITTGSTLSECSRVLLGAGAAAVYCATVCRDLPGKNKK